MLNFLLYFLRDLSCYHNQLFSVSIYYGTYISYSSLKFCYKYCSIPNFHSPFNHTSRSSIFYIRCISPTFCLLFIPWLKLKLETVLLAFTNVFYLQRHILSIFFLWLLHYFKFLLLLLFYGDIITVIIIYPV